MTSEIALGPFTPHPLVRPHFFRCRIRIEPRHQHHALRVTLETLKVPQPRDLEIRVMDAVVKVVSHEAINRLAQQLAAIPLGKESSPHQLPGQLARVSRPHVAPDTPDVNPSLLALEPQAGLGFLEQTLPFTTGDRQPEIDDLTALEATEGLEEIRRIAPRP
jgi:hypothetical protein